MDAWECNFEIMQSGVHVVRIGVGLPDRKSYTDRWNDLGPVLLA